MFSIGIVYFREFLEISLIVGMIIGAMREIQNKFSYIFCGLFMGILGSLFFAFILDSISEKINDEIEDIFISLILFINVIMITYTISWMKSYSSKTIDIIKKSSNKKFFSGITSYSTSFIIAFAIIREGIEIILFTHGVIISSKSNFLEILFSGITGSSLGIITGFITYYGVIKLPIKYFFKITSSLLILLAASLASQIPIYLESADILNTWSRPIWDSSWLINQQSLAGKILHSFIGYSDKPSLMQITFYLTTILLISVTKYFSNKNLRIIK